jgi:AraC-like DNA-binding protein
MSTIQCEFIQEEQLFDCVYTAEVKLINGTFPHKAGIINTSQIKNGAEHLQLRCCYLEIDKGKNLYRLFYQVTTDSIKKCERSMQAESFDQSLSRLQAPTNKVLFLIDESTLFESLAIIYYLELINIETHIYIDLNLQEEGTKKFLQKRFPNSVGIASSFSEDNIFPILDQQLIGSKLYISGLWPMISDIKKISYTAGFTDEEILINGIGEKNEKVFCVKCYQLNHKQLDSELEFTCKYCNSTLDVSNHYSKRLEAYLGYIKVV